MIEWKSKKILTSFSYVKRFSSMEKLVISIQFIAQEPGSFALQKVRSFWFLDVLCTSTLGYVKFLTLAFLYSRRYLWRTTKNGTFFVFPSVTRLQCIFEEKSLWQTLKNITFSTSFVYTIFQYFKQVLRFGIDKIDLI